MIDQLRDANNEVRLYCTEYVHYVFKHQFKPERQYPSPFDGVEGGLQLNDIGLYNAACIGQVTEQYYYVPDAVFHSPGVDYVGHSFPWAALPVELDQVGRKYRLVVKRSCRR